MKKTAKIIALVAFMSITTAGTRQAHAISMLSVDDGTTFVTVTDNGAGDSDANVGFIHYLSTPGTFANFMSSISLGITKPILGSADLPQLHLNTVDVSSFGASADTLTIKFTDTDFADLAPIATGFMSEIGGVTQGSVTFVSYYDNSNAAFGTTSLLADLGSFSGGAFSASELTSVGSLTPAPAGPYSLTMVGTVTHSGGIKVTSFDASVSVPEPSTLLLLGSGMLGFAFMRRRKS